MRKGVLYLHRSQAGLDRGAANMQILKEAGQEFEVVDRERAAAIDPALAASKDKIAGAIYSPSDESGDACKFTRGFAALAAERGARFRYRTTIRAIAGPADWVRLITAVHGDQRLAAPARLAREVDELAALADLVCQRPGLVRQDVGDRDAGTLVGIAPADRGADAARAAGDDRDLARKLHQVPRFYQQV
jgi:FAD dependent oxidoreductase